MNLVLKLVFVGALGSLSSANAQTYDELYSEALALDQMLFEQSFNGCDTSGLTNIIAEDLEFYHDVGGLMRGKQAYIDSIANGICQLEYKASRELKEGSFKVFPLRDNGELYAMIVEGEHSFYAQYAGSSEQQQTSDANFSILWLKEATGWKMKRVYSFNHQ